MPETKPLRIGTRGSALALYQANYVKDLLEARGRPCELVILKTQGDKDRTTMLSEFGGVGVFVKELERALVDDEVDVAVHSLKDLPTDQPEGLVVAAQPVRVSVHELLIVHPDAWVEPDEDRGGLPLKEGARVGTASLRRKAQLRELRPDLEVVGIRGNVPGRVDKARTREVDAVMLAAAGIDRLELELEGLRRFDVPAEMMLPAPGQGALGIEVRSGDRELVELLRGLSDRAVERATEAERRLLHELGAGCSVPLGAHAEPAPEDGEQGVGLRAVLQVNRTEATLPHMHRAYVRASSPAAAAELALRVLAPALRGAAAHLSSEPELPGASVVIAREPERAARLLELLGAAGARAYAWAPTTRVPLAEGAAVNAAVAAVPDGGWLLFASANAVEAFAAVVDPVTFVERVPRLRLGAVGPATARALAEADLPVDLLTEEAHGAGGAALAQTVLERFGAERPAVLLPAARGGRAELEDGLRAAGCAVTRLELYESVPSTPPAVEDLDVDALMLASPSGARSMLGGPALPARCRLVAIGETTAAEVRSLGHEVAATAEEPTPQGLFEAVLRALGRR